LLQGRTSIVIREFIGQGRLFPVLLFCGVLLVFAPVHRHEFVNFDDPGYITENPQVRAGLTRAGIAWAFAAFEQYNWHPVTWLSHMVDCQIFGLAPAGHHWVNVLLHAASTVLLFLMLKRTTRAPGTSAFVAALFAVHPLRVESVAWAAERKDVLGAFFWMWTTWAYVRYTETGAARRYASALVFFILGLMSKPTLVTLPFALLLLDYWPLQRWELPGRRSLAESLGSSRNRRLLREKIPYLLLAAVSSWITLAAQASGGSVVSLHIFSMAERAANALISYAAYLWKILWPAGLAVFYPRPLPIPPWQVVAAALMLTAVSIFAFKNRIRRPYLAVGWLWYLGVLFPMIGLVQVGEQAMADRYTYLPSIGIFLMAGYGISGWLDEKKSLRRLAPVLTLAVASLYAVAATRQLGHWQDSVSLYRHALRVTGINPTASVNLGAALVEKGKPEEALAVYLGALQQDPDLADAHVNAGVLLAAEGRFEEAIGHYREALRVGPAQAELHNEMGVALAATGRGEEAERQFREALELRPAYPEAHCNLGDQLAGRERWEDAVAEYGMAVQHRPEYFEAHDKLGVALMALSRPTEAAEHFRAAEVAKASDADFHYRFAAALFLSGRRLEALRHFRSALRLRPEWPEALNSAAWILATETDLTPADRSEAVLLAEKACALAPRPDAALRDTLAAAHAAAGHFDRALQEAQTALALARDAKDGSLVREIEGRIRLYRQGRAYPENR